MFCTKCGAKIDDSFKFCTSCGSPVGEIHDQSSLSAPLSTSVKQSDSVTAPKRFTGMGWLVGIVIVAFLMIEIAIPQYQNYQKRAEEVKLAASSAVESAQTSPTQPQPAEAPKNEVPVPQEPAVSQSISNTYERYADGKIDPNGAEITISDTGNGKVKITGNSTWIGNAETGNVNVAENEAIASLEGNTIHYKDDACKFDINISPDSLIVKNEEGECGGLNVTYSGVYRKSNSQKNTDPNQPDTSLTPVPNNSPVVFAPSFDCAKVSSGTERLICSNADLSALDAKLVQLYRSNFANSSDKNAFKKAQNDWRTLKREACSDVACLTKAYNDRISELSNTASKTPSAL